MMKYLKLIFILFIFLNTNLLLSENIHYTDYSISFSTPFNKGFSNGGGLGGISGIKFRGRFYPEFGVYSFPGSQTYLDSVGCTVFSTTISDTLPIPSTLSFPDAIGLVMAHELGHTVGMEHTDGYSATKKGVMESNLPIGYQYFDITEYNLFIRGSLDDCDDNGNPQYHQSLDSLTHKDYDAMNLRDILGINNVHYMSDILWFP